MFHKIKYVTPIENNQLLVQFFGGITKKYDVSKLLGKIKSFDVFLEDSQLFYDVSVDVGGYGVIWNDDLDISSEEIWAHGEQVDTPFEGLMSFSDASEAWMLSESALRKAVAYGKFVVGIDVCKFGKQWVVSTKAMNREYGSIKS